MECVEERFAADEQRLSKKECHVFIFYFFTIAAVGLLLEVALC